MKMIIVVFAALLGLIAGFFVSPDLAGYPLYATEEQLQKIRLQEIKEYLLVGTFIGGCSALASILTKSKEWAPYVSVIFVVLVYIVFEAYRVQGELFLYHFQRTEYLAFFVTSFLFCGLIQIVRYYHVQQYT